MNRSEAKEYVILQEPDFLERARNINGRHSYVCPCCNNGAGRDGTGITMIPNTNEHPIYKCFKCGEAGDVIELAKHYTGYDSFRENMNFLFDHYGLVVDGYESQNRNPIKREVFVKPIEDDRPPAVSQKEYFKKVQASLDASYLEERGISLNTQKHYGVGTDLAWINPVVKARYESEGKELPEYMKSPRCIIPISEFAYLARDTRKVVPKSNEKYQKIKYGQVQLFAKEDIKNESIFAVTEGEIDAMSFYEATNGEVKATGLGSTSNWRKLVNAIIEGEISPDGVILALDNDEAGIKARENIETALNSMGIPSYAIVFDGKDPNDALRKNRNAFKAVVENAIEELSKGKEMD